MRDQRFVAEHRGGPLKKAQHRQLMRWACKCAGHLLPLLGGRVDPRLTQALAVAKKWERGGVRTGETMRASRDAHAAARDASHPTAAAVARAVGHAVATAHMADHALGPALYGLKAVKSAERDVAAEWKWQRKRIPANLRDLVLTALRTKEKRFKL